jgi:hypothetical protein
MNPCTSVKRSLSDVAREAKHVSINEEGLANFIARLVRYDGIIVQTNEHNMRYDI